MRVFISYRRDDTAGRAGRLFDVLVKRFGARNVFQDVAAIAPGAEFTKQVAEAIGASDVTLVVIGSEWLTIRDTAGQRRLDDPEDYVRAEVRSALVADVSVVPVLVGDATLPTTGDLPGDMHALVARQAARLRDDSWHQDVDALVRRLEGAEPIAAGARRRPLLMAGAATVVLLAGLVAWVWLGRGGDGGGSDDDTALTGCPRSDSSWTPITLIGTPTDNGSSTTQSFSVGVEAVDFKALDDANTMVLRVVLENTGTGGEYFSEAMVDGLLVDGFSIGKPTCFSMLSADQNVEPGEGARALVGWEDEFDPAGVPLVLKVNGGDVAFDVEITDGA